MTIQRPNPVPNAEPIVVLHMRHGSYFGYEGNDDRFRVLTESGEEVLDTDSFSDFATLFVESAADV